jgi:hypothetical protein
MTGKDQRTFELVAGRLSLDLSNGAKVRHSFPVFHRHAITLSIETERNISTPSPGP